MAFGYGELTATGVLARFLIRAHKKPSLADVLQRPTRGPIWILDKRCRLELISET